MIPIPFVENLEQFMNLDYELTETTPFFYENFLPMKIYYSRIPTKARLILFGSKYSGM